MANESNGDNLNNIIANPESEPFPPVTESAVDVPEVLLKKVESEKQLENSTNKINNGQLEGMDPETGNYIRPKNPIKPPSTKNPQNEEIQKETNLKTGKNGNVSKKALQRGVNF